mgnify:CR=1 FL=1
MARIRPVGANKIVISANCAAGLRNQIDALAGKTAKFVDDELTWYNSMVVVVFKGALPREVASPPQEYLSELLFIRDSETRVHHVVALGTDGGSADDVTLLVAFATATHDAHANASPKKRAKSKKGKKREKSEMDMVRSARAKERERGRRRDIGAWHPRARVLVVHHDEDPAVARPPQQTHNEKVQVEEDKGERKGGYAIYSVSGFEGCRIIKNVLTYEQQLELDSSVSAKLLKEGKFIHPFKGVTFYIKGIESDGTLLNVFLHDRRNKDEFLTYTATRAFLAKDENKTFLYMENGLIQTIAMQI